MPQSVAIISNQTLNAHARITFERPSSARPTAQGKATTHFCVAAALIVVGSLSVERSANHLSSAMSSQYPEIRTSNFMLAGESLILAAISVVIAGRLVNKGLRVLQNQRTLRYQEALNSALELPLVSNTGNRV